MNAQGPPPGFWPMFICILVVGLIIGLTIQIFFLLTLYRTQSQVAERNREIQPGTIWWTILINFIPLVGNLWIIYMVTKLSNSLRREFEDRGWRTEDENFARTTGLIYAWGGLVYTCIAVVQNILQFSGNMEASTLLSVITLPIALGLLICWIIYWVQMYQYGKRLREAQRGYRDHMEADYDDEFRRPRREGDDLGLDDDRPRRRDDLDRGERPRRSDDELDDDRRDRPRRDDY